MFILVINVHAQLKKTKQNLCPTSSAGEAYPGYAVCHFCINNVKNIIQQIATGFINRFYLSKMFQWHYLLHIHVIRKKKTS